MKRIIVKILFFVVFLVMQNSYLYGQGQWQTSGNDIFYNYNNGNVGIGLSNPGYRLEISKDFTNAGGRDIVLNLKRGLFDYTNGARTTLSFQNADVIMAGIEGIRIGGWSSGLVFYTHSNASGNSWDTTILERMRIDNNGNVGIGTTSPTSALDIGTGNLTIAGGAQEGHLRIGGGYRWAGLKSRNSNYSYLIGDDPNENFELAVYNHNAATYTWGIFKINPTAPANSIVINNNGNIGIGTTSTPEKLSVGGRIVWNSGTSMLGSDQGGSIELGNGLTPSTRPYLDFHYGIGSGQDYNARIVNYADKRLDFVMNGNGTVMAINGDKVGIGTVNPDEKLAVAGKIKAQEVIVTMNGWADFVFDDDYTLMPLQQVEQHIKTDKHLPGIPTAKQISADGVSVGEMQARLLQKVEELTLYVIEQDKKINELQKQNMQLQNMICNSGLPLQAEGRIRQ